MYHSLHNLDCNLLICLVNNINSILFALIFKLWVKHYLFIFSAVFTDLHLTDSSPLNASETMQMYCIGMQYPTKSLVLDYMNIVRTEGTSPNIEPSDTFCLSNFRVSLRAVKGNKYFLYRAQ